MGVVGFRLKGFKGLGILHSVLSFKVQDSSVIQVDSGYRVGGVGFQFLRLCRRVRGLGGGGAWLSFMQFFYEAPLPVSV